jgi:hypothetical protein
VRTVLVSDDSISRIVGRSGVAASDLGVLEPIGKLRDISSPRRLQPIRVRGDWTVEHIATGRGGWFCVVRVHELGTKIEALHLLNPSAVQAAVALDTQGQVQENGRRAVWDFLPSLLPVGSLGDTVLSVVHRGHPGPPRVLHLPPVAAFAGLTAGAEEYGLSPTVLPDGRHVVVESGAGGGRLVFWDALAGQKAADVVLSASGPMVFTSAISPDGTLWAASIDTLYELDPSTWAVTFSARLGQGPTGSFIPWLSSIDGGRTVLIGRNGRRPAPGGGEVLALDTHNRTLESLARLPMWTRHAVLRRQHGDLVVESWGDDRQYWQVPVKPEARMLFPAG